MPGGATAVTDVLLDVNVVVDICAERTPFVLDALRALEVCKKRRFPVRLYAGSVQTMQYSLASEFNRTTETAFGTCLRQAAAVLERFSRDKLWMPALTEDGPVFLAEDPEDQQLIQAVARVPGEAVLLTRDGELRERCPHALTPAEFISRYDGGSRTNTVVPAPPAFVDLRRQLDAYRGEIEREIWRAVDSTAFINGPAVAEFEEQLAAHTGVKHAIGCSSGTDALTLGMMALDVKRGDEIILPDFTFIATAETVALLGAIPVFADIRPDTCNVDPESIRAAITDKTVGIIPVSLYGQIADMDEINVIAKEHGLWVMEDGAQSYGATYKGKRSCALSRIGTTSFFPAKPLGAYGDAGAVFTDDDELATRLRMILNHGQRKRYDHAVIGLNARIDTLQAAILKVKLKHFDDEVVRRRQVADWYTADFADVKAIVTPKILTHNTSVWAQYTIRVPNRPAVQAALKEKGIPTAVHYPIPLHRQDAFAAHAQHGIVVPHTEKAGNEVMSLPMHPFMTRDDVTTVTEAVKAAVLEPVHG